jgi:3-keto-5-aminohexanoate cleavage enzyme
MALAANLAKPLIISCAITRAITTRKEHPSIPYTPTEIVESSLRAIEAGASIVHIHVCEPDGTPSSRAEYFAEVFEGIRAESNALICASTGSGAGRFAGHERT